MTQRQDMQKRYSTPALTVYGRLEDVTLLWSNPTATDNTCPGAVGSQGINSGAFCAAGDGGGSTEASTSGIVAPDGALVDPLADPLSDGLSGG